MKVRKFTKYDWYGFAGAERFKNGEEPFFVEMDDWAMVVDKNGCNLFHDADEAADEYGGYYLELEFKTEACALVFIDGLSAISPTFEQFINIGFRSFNSSWDNIGPKDAGSGVVDINVPFEK